ncbi:MAG: hypothetical protein M3150_04850 [Pseudomonadota bacterium]|nr:hypothetical protein [Pseudomonadota bacterium]
MSAVMDFTSSRRCPDINGRARSACLRPWGKGRSITAELPLPIFKRLARRKDKSGRSDHGQNNFKGNLGFATVKFGGNGELTTQPMSVFFYFSHVMVQQCSPGFCSTRLHCMLPATQRLEQAASTSRF